MNSQSLIRAKQISAKFRGEEPAKAGIRAATQKDGRGELLIYEDIGIDFWSGTGVTAKDVMDQLNTLKGCKGIDVRFSCFGGDVFEGKAIYEALKRFDCQDIVAHIDSIAASAASFIAMACKTIVMSPAATMMIHSAWSMAMGNAADLRATADILTLEDGNIASIYAAKTKKPMKDILALMAVETWMNADQAVEMGFADSIARDDGKEDVLAPAAKAIAATQSRIVQSKNLAVNERLSALGKRLENRASPVNTAGQPAQKK